MKKITNNDLYFTLEKDEVNQIFKRKINKNPNIYFKLNTSDLNKCFKKDKIKHKNKISKN